MIIAKLQYYVTADKKPVGEAILLNFKDKVELIRFLNEKVTETSHYSLVNYAERK